MENITEKCVKIIVKGQNEKDIDASMGAAFDHVLKRLKAGRGYGLPKSIGKSMVTFGVEESTR